MKNSLENFMKNQFQRKCIGHINIGEGKVKINADMQDCLQEC